MGFMPIRDVDEYPMVTPFVTIGLIIANVLIYLVQPAIPPVSNLAQIPVSVRAFYDTFAVVPFHVAHGHNLMSVFTSMFIHGGLLHLASNMLYLWIFGDNIEHAFGHVRYLIFYLVSGLAATAAQVFVFPEATAWVLGSSGAIAGVLGAYLVLFPRARIDALMFFGFFYRLTRVSALVVIGVWFALQLVSGSSQLGTAGMQGGVAYWAHIGGFVAGLSLAAIAKRGARLGPAT